MPTMAYKVACIRPHYAYSGLVQPQLWRAICTILKGAYPKPCSFGAFCGHGLACGCFAANSADHEAPPGADEGDRSAAVIKAVRDCVEDKLHSALVADVEALASTSQQTSSAARWTTVQRDSKTSGHRHI
eukprot:SAG25_NODE_4075_length_896_cov_1.179423_2_plen_130_part_00